MSLISDLIEWKERLDDKIQDTKSTKKAERLYNSFMNTEYDLDKIYVAKLFSFNRKTNKWEKSYSYDVVLEYIYDNMYINIANGYFFEDAVSKVKLDEKSTYIVDPQPYTKVLDFESNKSCLKAKHILKDFESSNIKLMCCKSY